MKTEHFVQAYSGTFSTCSDILILIWVGFLGVRFEVVGGGW